MAEVALTAQEIDLIGRVVETEVPSYIRSRNPNEYNRMVGAVIDTILNRTVTGRYGATVEDVLDQRRAFSKITGPSSLSPYGSVQNAPRASGATQRVVNEHIAGRVKGIPSEINGAVNYANPNYSSKGNIDGWINPMIAAGALKLGIEPAVHYHGNAPGAKPAGYYDVYKPLGFMPPVAPDQAIQLSKVPTERPERSFAAPAGVVERAPLPSIQDIARTKGYQQYGASRAAALQPTLPDTIAAPPTLTRSEDYFGPTAAIPRSRPVTPADMPYSVSPRAAPAIDPVTVRATAAGAPSVGVHGTGTTSPMAGFDETVPATPTMGFPEAPKTPGRQAREAAAKGAVMGALTGGPFGAVVGAALGPARNQIMGNIRSNMQGMGRVPVLSGVRDAYRSMFDFNGGSFGGMFSGIPSPNYSASPFSVGSGYGAIDSVFGGPAGATAYSRSDPSISFTSLGNGYVSRHNADFNTTQTMAPGSYDAGMFSGKSPSKGK